MSDDVLEFAETLIHEKTEVYCSELQRRILMATLQGERKTYDQLAEECGYSAKYVKQDVAPKLWQLLSQALDQKIHKSNVRAALEQRMRQVAQADPIPEPPVEPPAVAGTYTLSNSAADALAAPIAARLTTPKPLSANILLVDDQPKNLRLLSDLLEEQGYDVQQAINGSVALQVVALDQPSLILLDIHMPDMDGYTVCQHLKADPNTQDIPVIFVSALDEAWDKVRAFSVGAADFITKPFKVVEVLARVENQLKIQQLQQELKAQNAQLQQAIQELQRLAALDEVTQVATRRRFDAYLEESWRRSLQAQAPLTLMLVQLGTFTQGEGGEDGDRELQRVAQSLKRLVQGPQDLVSRYGTLTFAVVLPEQEGAEAIAQALLKQIQMRPVEQSAPTLSIGIATAWPSPNLNLGRLIEACDQALQQAQSQGSNSIVKAGFEGLAS
ncbi:MAG: response regulator [Elainellaceae cyanobacterium]